MTFSIGSTEGATSSGRINYGMTLPLSKWITLRAGDYTSQKANKDGLFVFKGNPSNYYGLEYVEVDCSGSCNGDYSDNIIIDSNDIQELMTNHKYFMLDVHIPIYKLWKK